MKTENKLKVLDCTIRDGGYINDWDFDTSVVRDVYRNASKAGVDIVEIGFRGSDKYFDRSKLGPWRFSPEDLIREAVDGINGAQIAVMGDCGKVDVEDFLDSRDSVIKLVRIAAHKPQLADAITLLEQIKDKGYEVSLNAMGVANYSGEERARLAGMVRESRLDYICLADSNGSLFPDQIYPLFEPYLDMPGIQIGFHAHNNLQMAFANTLEAIRCGVNIVDATMFGMGRGPGNLPTEILLTYLQRERPDKFNPIPVLDCIDLRFVEYEHDNPWGYQLPYMISGVLECHPYYAKNLINRRRYTMEEIWKALEVIKKRRPIGYKPELVEEIIENGLIGDLGSIDENRMGQNADANVGLAHKITPAPVLTKPASYKDRHQGRTFLVLGNGPTLKTYQHKIASLIEMHNPVVLGANYLGGLFEPDYHAFTSVKRFKKYADNVAANSSLLIGQTIDGETVSEYTKMPYETLHFNDVLNAPFGIDEYGVIQTNCRTVSVLLLGVAIAMGADRILAVGLDGYVDTDVNGQFYFYNEEDEIQDKELIISTQRWCEKHISGIDSYLRDQGREGIHILTPTSYKSFYRGIDNYLQD